MPLSESSSPTHRRHEQANGEYFVDKAIDGKIDDTNGWAIEGMTRHENRGDVCRLGAVRVRRRHDAPRQTPSRNALHRPRYRSLQSLHEQRRVPRPRAWSGWHLLGPFKRAGTNEVFDNDFGPETGVDLAKTYGEGNAAWVAKPEFVDGESHGLEGDLTTHYLYRTVLCRRRRA